MKINVIYFGKIKNKELIKLLNYYIKLVSKYFSFSIIEIKDPGERKINKDDVRDKLGEFNIFLSEKGKEFNSIQFSQFLETKKNTLSSINFIIGNAYGFEENVYASSNLTFSLSQLTFPHELSLVILLEQIFRAGSINQGAKYHK